MLNILENILLVKNITELKSLSEMLKVILLFDLTVPTDVNAMCIFIQEKFDQTFGHSWNIICGEAFSSSLTFQV